LKSLNRSGFTGGRAEKELRVLAAAQQYFCLAFLLRYPEATVFHAVQDAISNQTYS
jgi:hypothetical protein